MTAYCSRSRPILASAVFAGLIAQPLQAETATAPTAIAPESTPVQAAITVARQDDAFAAFAPSDRPIKHKIDYSIWTEALRATVLSMGPSLRKTAGEPARTLNTRRQYGPVSRYRLEGSLMGFQFLDRKVIASFTEYRRDLEQTSDKIDIQSLSRNEQLAYWFNLHNVALVEQLASNWPVRQPRELKVGGVPVDDAKIVTVEGVPMSLRDIRENIVYRHWNDPKVIYGFWRGEIGGPALQREAFNAQNVSQLLDFSAREFVNSLRGTQKHGGKLLVSTLYADTAEFFFPDLEADVRSHIAKYAEDDVKELMTRTTGLKPSIREWDIADMSGGVREPAIYSASYFTVPPAMARLMRQRQRKFELLIRAEIPTGYVVFSNITLPGQENTNEVD